MPNNKNKIKYSGFSLVEVLIVMFIAAIVFTTFYTTATLGTKYIIESKNRLGAVAFLNEKVEISRNLKYDDVGIEGGVPSGKLIEQEDVSANGRVYHVRSSVQYIDDPLDGEFPADIIPNDYKIAKVTVSWKGTDGTDQEISSVLRFVPPGLEASAGGAPLAINVKGGDGEAVKQSQVHIVNTTVVPALNFTVQTDDVGHIMLPSAPESMGGYQITVSKNGYETVATQNSPALDYKNDEYIPIYTHGTVLLGALNMYDYIQDKLSKIIIKTTDYQNLPIGDIAFAIDGGKVLGLDAVNANVYNLHEAGVTDVGTGQKEYSNVSPGNYVVAMTANAQYDFVDYLPNLSSIAVAPGTDFVYEVKLADKNINGIMVNVSDSVENLPIVDAKVSLKDDSGVDIFVQKPVSVNGVMYYPDSANPLSAGSYTLKVEATNYTTQEVTVNINELTKVEVKLVVSI
ncbi:MAG: hypothetical protein ACD_8C00066G0007 [uncultured bacterium]|nr:MAG: hypothetical protein ACD_8C00066G0007 [uncultured bacterium]